jgi:FkbM family methyltransferase
MEDGIQRIGVALNRALRPLGVRLGRYPAPPDRRLMRLLERYAIATVVDIGANTGQYGIHLRQLGYRGRIESFEPLPSAFAQLAARASRDERWRTTQKAVAKDAGSVTLHVSANSVSSSILEMTSRHCSAAPESATVADIVVQAISLDSILSGVTEMPILVKIDTQGYEREVLGGGEAMLSRISLLELEMSLVELYAGQPLFEDLHAWVTSSGFQLVSMGEGFFDEETGELLQIEAIYARGK